jgi:hypothetical protein
MGVGVMARLEVVSPQSLAGQAQDLSADRIMLGRAPDADFRLPDQHVSRRHAVVWHSTAGDEIEDLGSTAGTYVNGTRISGRHPLRAGDVVRLGPVELSYGAERDATVHFSVGQQQAGVISNVGRDQYHQYFQQVVVERENAFHEIDSMNRVAKVLYLVGFALAGAGVLTFIGSGVLEMAKSAGVDISDPASFQRAMEPIEIFGLPLFAVAMGVALIGFALAIMAGIIHAAVGRKRREVDERFPLPHPPYQ